MKTKNKYRIGLAIYGGEDGKTCMRCAIFKGDKIIYCTNQRWQINLLINLERVIVFFGIDGNYMWDGTKNPDFEKIKNYEITNN